MNNSLFQIWIDTGGTFTDCIALDKDGNLLRTKVLSNSALRGTILDWIDGNTVRVEQNWNAPSGFIDGFEFKFLQNALKPIKVTSFNAEKSTIRFSRNQETFEKYQGPFEVISREEAPILAARLVTGTNPDKPLPPIDLRLATTRGTNALLERKGNPPHLFITRGFRDLLKIGDQKRPDLFALNIEKPPPLYKTIIEIPERIDAEGRIIQKLDTESLKQSIAAVTGDRKSAAVCLMHGYMNSTHEDEVYSMLEEAGYRYISVSSRLSPFIKILPRAQTAVVNAYLSPVLQEYIESIRQKITKGSFRMMTSAGGLVQIDQFYAKDSLLSGPAGGVVGATAAGKQAGFRNIISFDMGGTSTDVARHDDGYDYVFEHSVGGIRLAAPALSIETVAAGGGSVCSFDGFKLSVGPESAGADPGPACYGAGGPLTLTDVNLLLGRLEPDNFGIPLDLEAAEKKLEELVNDVQKEKEEDISSLQILEGFIDIANERMADAIGKISLRKGYDPKNYAMVAFGGAGAQHACAIADQLDIKEIIVPSDAGILSAYGLGHAVIEQFAEKQVLAYLPKVEPELASLFDTLVEQAVEKLEQEGIPPEETVIRKKLIFMRLEGQESTLEIEFKPETNLQKLFEDTYAKRYGHWISNRKIEIESIRAIVSGKEKNLHHTPCKPVKNGGIPFRKKFVVFQGERLETTAFSRKRLEVGQQIEGPALIMDPYSTIVVEPGWNITVLTDGSLTFKRKRDSSYQQSRRSEAVDLELFTNRFTSIAEEMGEMLRRTALSVNVKERMDFSCALLNAEGELVVNAPHIPVHLGALGLCVRRLKDAIEMKPGDVVVTNHPAFGGSHLPDITIVTPIFTSKDTLIGFAASRAHHAEIGGTRPGSMPPDATTLVEEGVVIPPMYLLRQEEEKWMEIRSLLTSAAYPTRAVEENMADLQAAVAANHRGARSVLELAEQHGEEKVLHYMTALKKYAAQKMKSTIQSIQNGEYEAEEILDDKTTLKVKTSVTNQHIHFDFNGTDGVHPGNLNATPAIVNSVIIYILRLLIDESLPLNEGLLVPVTINLPPSLLNPDFSKNPDQCPAVVGGNVETSQRLVDLLLKPFEKIGCSQGTMNNVLFGNDSFGYYETIGGGTGAGRDFHGADAVHHHMTNTAGTDPEILEKRYPVRLERYAIRKNSGGSGKYHGGEGILREMTFLQPVSLSVLTQHRTVAPYGINGGKPGAKGRQWVRRKDGTETELNSVDGKELSSGDRFIILTPGGGGYGKS